MCKSLKISDAKGKLVGQCMARYRSMGVVTCGHASNYEEAVIELEMEPGWECSGWAL